MNHCFRTAAIHIALAAMLLRALMPAGWMPNADAAAGTPIAICTMNGPMRIDFGAEPIKKNNNQDDSRHHQACPFAVAPHMAQPATTAALLLPSSISLTVRFFRPAAQFFGPLVTRPSLRAPHRPSLKRNKSEGAAVL